MLHAELNGEMQKCISECLACFASCTATTRHCLSLGGEHAAPEHVTLLRVCAEACQSAATAMLMNSLHHAAFCRLCSDICEECANECELMGGDDVMEDCARDCRQCAQSCREMSGAGLPLSAA